MNWWVFVKCEPKSSQLKEPKLFSNYFSLCALNLFNTRFSQFELNYWNKWTFPRHSNLLRCTCVFFRGWIEIKYCHTTLNTSECDVYVINIEKSMEKHVSDHSNHIWKWSPPYMVTNRACERSWAVRISAPRSRGCSLPLLHRSAQFRSPLTYNFIPLRWNRSTLAHI